MAAGTLENIGKEYNMIRSWIGGDMMPELIRRVVVLIFAIDLFPWTKRTISTLRHRTAIPKSLVGHYRHLDKYVETS